MQSIGTARIGVVATGAVLVAVVTGLVTGPTIRDVRRALARMQARSSAVVVDYSRAAVAVTECDLAALSISAPACSAPIAWVVPTQEIADNWRRQALRLALVGLRRYVTCDPEDAARWARQQASLAEGHQPR